MVFFFLQRKPLPSPFSSYLQTVVTPWRRQAATCRWWCLMMPVTSHRRYEQLLLYVSTSSYFCVLCTSASSLSLPEWQLCAAHVVVGQPTEACLSGEDGHSCPVILTLSLLLHHRHGGADQGSGAGYRDAGSHRYFSVFFRYWFVFDYNKLNGGCCFSFVSVL